MQIDQADSTDWISFLPSNQMEEISADPEALGAKPKTFNQHGTAEKTKNHLGTMTNCKAY